MVKNDAEKKGCNRVNKADSVADKWLKYCQNKRKKTWKRTKNSGKLNKKCH